MRLLGWWLPVRAARAARGVVFHPDGSVTVSGYSASEALRICRELAVAGKLPAPSEPQEVSR